MITRDSSGSEARLRPFVHYLETKIGVDDRALNKDVVAALRSALAERSSGRPSVLELGGGIGTMLARMLDWKLIERAHYEIVELDPGLIGHARSWLAGWARSRGYELSEAGSDLRIRGEPIDVTVRFSCRELAGAGAPSGPGAFDLLIAHAVLDLVDVPATLPRLFAELAPAGLFWLTINFDGQSVFLPEHAADRALLEVYHRSMDERVRDGSPCGDKHTGRHLFRQIPAAGGAIVAAGASDWVVRASDGRYPASELEFLHHILDTIEVELSRQSEVDAGELARWLSERRTQANAGTLTYLAHQWDFLGTKLGAARSNPDAR